MRRSDFDFDLPEALIAQHPLSERSASRLLALDGASGLRRDLGFRDLPSLLRPGDLLVFNNTRVLPARLFANKPTGGRVEILIERLLGEEEALAHVRASKTPQAGSELRLPDGASVKVIGRQEGLFVLQATNRRFAELMRRHGHMPLPPYIKREDDASDAERYQTIFAERDGAVAAPTAGLHFDPALLAALAEVGVHTARITLHVGAGTFQPVREEDLDRHQMHAEWLEVGTETVEKVRATRAGGGRVIAVGTTTVRSLETAAAASNQRELQAYRGESRLFIRPGYRFQVTDAMITNFHLPQSTLLMLVSAFAGHHSIMAAYRHAIEQRYRFFSYGDAMFLTRPR